MIRTKKQLIEHLEKLGNQIIKKGILFKELSQSIKQYQKQKTLKEWLKLINFKIELEGGLK